jgi:DNA-directed RNA polymerase subunit A"
MTRFLTQSEINNILDFIKPRKGIPEDSAELIVKNTKETFEKQLKTQKVYPEIIPQLKEQLEKIYFKSMIPAGESVGVICAQSIGERNTQTTLNSVDYYDKILYMKDNKIFVQNIGEFIDILLENNKENIVKYQENQTDYLDIDSGYFIPSGDENGFVHWKPITAVTKHLPNGQLVKVSTRSGRIVSASQSKSFLTWKENKFIDTLGSEVKVGDILPTTKKLNRFGEIKEYFELETIISKKTRFGKKIALTNDFGFLIGIYLSSEGLSSNEYVCIKNNDKKIKNKIRKWCIFNGIDNDFIYKENIVRIFSHSLVCILQKTCGTKSNKYIPLFAYTAPDDFIMGLIDGYYSGIGYINRNGSISVNSVSKELINGISFLLSYYGIFSKIVEYKKCDIIFNHLYISISFAKMFANKFKITYDKKQLKLNNITLTKKLIDKNIDINYPDDRNVYFDEIKSIEYVEATRGFVYDLTVPDTYNFNLYNGLVVRDK